MSLTAIDPVICHSEGPRYGEEVASVRDDLSETLPRLLPLEPSQAINSFQICEGFRVELVAAEPLVVYPVAMAFDADGRLYVVEMRDYSEQDSEKLGTVRVLEGVDGDGRFDRSELFADNPTAIICYKGGILLGAAPDILFLRDDDGDLHADVRRTVFTGFGRSNVQGLLNSFQWGVDNRIYGATSSSGGKVYRADTQTKAYVSLQGQDFSWDPNSNLLEAVSGGGQHGLTFNRWSDRFCCHNSNHCMYIIAESRYLERNSYLNDGSTRRSIASDGPQAEVFRTSPEEPWRVLRTNWRIRDMAPGVIEGGGRSSGYFTSATGITAYEGDNWPDVMRGILLIADVGSNLIHRKQLRKFGCSYIAERIDLEKEFLSSSDNWFRPVQMCNGPDGALYIADMYREVIEHPLSLPPGIKEHIDLTSGSDRGRIYRIVSASHKQERMIPLSGATTQKLVALLDNRNAWNRRTAARLLYERQDPEASKQLSELLKNAKLPEGRIAVLHALSGQNQVGIDLLLAGLLDAHPEVRRQAVRLAESEANSSAKLRRELSSMTHDVSPRVLQQLAYTLGECNDRERWSDLAEIARQSVADLEILRAVHSSVGNGSAPLLALLWNDDSFWSASQGREFLQDLLSQIGKQQSSDDVAILTQLALQEARSNKVRLGFLLSGLGIMADNPLFQHLQKEKVFDRAILETIGLKASETAISEALPLADRLTAIDSLIWATEESSLKTIHFLLQPDQPTELQFALLEALERSSQERIAHGIITTWPSLTPELRDRATSLLLSRDTWAFTLLRAIDSGSLSLEDFGWSRMSRLVLHPSAEVRSFAEKLQSFPSEVSADDILLSYQDVLSDSGNRLNGEKVFRQNCFACHQHCGIGHPIGPNLTMAAAKGPETILFNILEPNHEVDQRYVTYTIQTINGLVYTGLIANESTTAVTLQRGADEFETIPRSSIEQIRSSGKSLMPEGLARDIGRTELADLFAYLCKKQ